jgi:hypothetical protein
LVSKQALRFDSGRVLFQRELAARICSRFQPFFFNIMNTLELFGPFAVPALALDLGNCTLFLLRMHYNFLKRILLGTLGVEYSS